MKKKLLSLIHVIRAIRGPNFFFSIFVPSRSSRPLRLELNEDTTAAVPPFLHPSAFIPHPWIHSPANSIASFATSYAARGWPSFFAFSFSLFNFPASASSSESLCDIVAMLLILMAAPFSKR
jgi:hypothetical protein